jgi:glycosyltransferase involved in cell wall biosynthesis
LQIVTNRQDEQKLTADKGLARIRHIPIGSNIPAQVPSGYDRAAWRASLDMPPDAILAGYFGFINASKGLEGLLRGVSLAVEQDLNLYLVLIGGRVGSSDPTNVTYADEVDDLIEQLNLTSRIRTTGFVTDAEVSGHLYACDMLILPYMDGVSFRRGSFMAGLAHGCAIITTTPEVELPEIQDGLNVRLVTPESPRALTVAIQSLIENPALRTQLQINAKALSREFIWEHIAERTLALYQELIQQSAPV